MGNIDTPTYGQALAESEEILAQSVLSRHSHLTQPSSMVYRVTEQMLRPPLLDL